MDIVKIHYKKSRPVEKWSDIEKEAKALTFFTTHGPFKGEHDGCVALHHSQVSDDPLNFFCVNERLPKELVEEIGGTVIVNPRIVGRALDKQFSRKEGCMSFPYRTSKHVTRFFEVTVEYQVPNAAGELVGQRRTVKGPAAAVFQHEIDHANAINIYGFTE